MTFTERQKLCQELDYDAKRVLSEQAQKQNKPTFSLGGQTFNTQLCKELEVFGIFQDWE